MNLPRVLAELMKAQNNFDSVAYANCFTETAVAFDEGKVHTGKVAIQKWVAEGNKNYATVMKPINFTKADKEDILTAEISGTFAGSPIILKYHLLINDGLIQSLKITG